LILIRDFRKPVGREKAPDARIRGLP